MHAETKDQWARDDPAFVFIMTGFLLVCQCLGFRHSPAPRWSDGSSSGCCCCLRHCIQHFLGRRVGLAVASSGATVLPDRRGRSYIRLVRSLRVCACQRGSGAHVLFSRWFSNKHLRVHHAHSVEQEVEWLYAFDIHCNGFFPLFVLLYVVQVRFCDAMLLAHPTDA